MKVYHNVRVWAEYRRSSQPGLAMLARNIEFSSPELANRDAQCSQ